MRKMKKMGILLVTVLMLLGADSTVFATVVYDGAIAMFSKEYVDSNEWTYICYSIRSSRTTDLEVKISKIYKADGSDSNYKKVKVYCSGGGYDFSTKIAQLNTTVSYEVPVGYGASGTTYKLYAMGNDPSLDCQITGSFMACNY
ncbi:MAG: hypothetical protein HDQ95_00155 [Roseburia sp.]|nr:hypothetical protein [Roseburia sp.]